MSFWKTSFLCQRAARAVELAKPAFRIQKNGHGEFCAEEYAEGMGQYVKLNTTKTLCFEETERRMLNLIENREKSANVQTVATYTKTDGGYWATHGNYQRLHEIK